MLYLDCFAGISGDMFLGACLDLGVDFSGFQSELKKLPVSGWELQVEKKLQQGITGTHCGVDLSVSNHEKIHSEEEEHHHRTCGDILKLIDKSELSKSVKQHASSMFCRLAEAEGKIHGVMREEVKFHEVGALDSIIDIIGAAVCMELLEEKGFYVSDVNVGSGYIYCAHGWLPVPAPATLEILCASGIRIYSRFAKTETVTPTGAAILAEYAVQQTGEIKMCPCKVGYGLGTRKLEIPNALRMVQFS